MRPLTLLSLLLPLTSATNPPKYSGYTLKWQSVFPYAKGVLPDSNNDKWNVITGHPTTNNEAQTYTRNPANVQNSGQGTLQLTPIKDAKEKKTTKHNKTHNTNTPTTNKNTNAEAQI